jgi:acyl-CoA hydrolase
MAFFISANMRKSMNEGRGDAVPIFLHDIPYLFERKIIPVDVAVISVRILNQIFVQRP